MAVYSLEKDWTLYWLEPGEWEAKRVWEQAPPEAAERRIPAVVPGHVQTALARAGRLPDPYDPLEESATGKDWIYEKRISIPASLAGQHLRLRFNGIAHAAVAFLNGSRLGQHTGQFLPTEWDISSIARPGDENYLMVVIHGRFGPRGLWRGCDPLVSGFGRPFPIPVGLSGSVELVATGPAWFARAAVHTNVSLDRAEAAISIVAEFGGTTDLHARVLTEIVQGGLPVTDVDDAVTIRGSETVLVQSITIPRAQLWWPNGYGRQPLYEARMALVSADGRVLDQRIVEFGIRTFEALPCDDAPPDSLPYVVSVNGKRIWTNGWVWLPADLYYADVSEADYEHLLRLARDAGVTMLRVWGGGILETETFYRLCDRYGILVWQDFPLETFPPAEPDGEYVRLTGLQGDAAVERLHNHPSLLIWSGGRVAAEIDDSPLGSDHPVLAELRASVRMDDTSRLWIPSTPTECAIEGGAVKYVPEGPHRDLHGPRVLGTLRDHPRLFNFLNPLLHTSFGVPSLASMETLRRIFGDNPPLPSREHPAWASQRQDWAVPTEFGPLESIEVLVRASQFIEALGLQYGVEANRRRQWHCAGTLPWSFNDPFPNAISCSAIDYCGNPKPAYYAVKRAYAPFHVSAQFDTFAWEGEAAFRADVWLHNSGAERSLLNVVATVTDLRGRELYQENLAGEAPENASENVGDLSWRFPPEFAEAFLLFLEVVDEEGEVIGRNAYLHSRAPEPPFRPFLEAPPTTLEVERTSEGVTVRNTGEAVAVSVAIEGGEALVEDSDFPLRPGAKRTIALSDAATAVTVSAWNAAPTELPRQE